MAFLGNGRAAFWSDARSDHSELIDLITIVSAEVGTMKAHRANGGRRAG